MAGSEASARQRSRLQVPVAYVVDGECVLRYDNEAGKGNHRHMGTEESGYRFAGLTQLLDDFAADIERWNHENGIA